MRIKAKKWQNAGTRNSGYSCGEIKSSSRKISLRENSYDLIIIGAFVLFGL